MIAFKRFGFIKMKYIYVMLLLLGYMILQPQNSYAQTTYPQSSQAQNIDNSNINAQSFSLSKDIKQNIKTGEVKIEAEKIEAKKIEAKKMEDYVIRPPKMNYAALCQANNLLNDDKIKYYLSEEEQGRFNAESYFHLAKIYYYGIDSVFQDKSKAMQYAKDAADIPSTWRKKSRDLVGKMQLKALKNGDETMARELQDTISMMRQEDGYNAGYYAGQMAELDEDYAQAFTHYRMSAAKNPHASLAIAALYFQAKLPTATQQKTDDMIKIGQNQLLGELNAGDCNVLMPIADMFLNGEVMKPHAPVGLEWLQVALQSGYSQAGVRLGEYYMSEGNSAMAINFWQQASDLGSKRAMFLLGDAALEHSKIKAGKQTKKALRFFKQSATLNYMPAILKLIEIYQGDHGANYADDEQLKYWKEKANAAPNPPSELLREMGLSTRIKHDYAASLKMLEQAAYGGSKAAWLDLAVAYRYGYGVKQDLAKSFKYATRAAKLGSAAGAYDLSEHYYCGIGTDKDQAKALFWQNEAKKRRNLQPLDTPLQNAKSKNAQTEHFLLLQHLFKTSKAQTKAGQGDLHINDLLWLQVAANNNHKQSALLLGDIYVSADNYDTKLALKYYEIAALLGSQTAMLRLQLLPLGGDDWLKTAESGVVCDGDIMFELANYYEIKGNTKQSNSYLQLASERGNVGAIKKLAQNQATLDILQLMK